MDREKLKEKKGKISKWNGCHTVRDALLEIIDALLQDEKSESVTEQLRREYPVRKTRYDWTSEELQAIKESIIHWRDNVSRLKLADDWRIEIVKHTLLEWWTDANSDKVIAYFNAGHCQLCMAYRHIDDCSNCPLFRSGDWCKPENSAWRKCANAKGNKEIISAAENMVKVLEGLLE